MGIAGILGILGPHGKRGLAPDLCWRFGVVMVRVGVGADDNDI